MYCLQLCGVSTLLLVLSILVAEVHGEYDVDIAGVVGSSVAAFLLLVIIIVLLALFLTWNTWFPAIQKAKGLMKMPRSYWKKKKEAKERLLQNAGRGSRRTTSSFVENGGLNGNVTANTRVRDTAFLPPTPLVLDSPSWVQGWAASNPPETTYEEMALAIDLDEERDEDEAVYTIETHTTGEEITPVPKTTTNPNPAPADPQGVRSPYVAMAVVKDHQSANPGEDKDEEFRIVAEVVDDEELDLNPYTTVDPWRRSQKGGGGGGGGGQGRGGSTAEQTLTMDMGEEEAQPPTSRTTAFNDFLDSSKVAF